MCIRCSTFNIFPANHSVAHITLNYGMRFLSVQSRVPSMKSMTKVRKIINRHSRKACLIIFYIFNHNLLVTFAKRLSVIRDNTYGWRQACIFIIFHQKQLKNVSAWLEQMWVSNQLTNFIDENATGKMLKWENWKTWKFKFPSSIFNGLMLSNFACFQLWFWVNSISLTNFVHFKWIRQNL